MWFVMTRGIDTLLYDHSVEPDRQLAVRHNPVEGYADFVPSSELKLTDDVKVTFFVGRQKQRHKQGQGQGQGHGVPKSASLVEYYYFAAGSATATPTAGGASSSRGHPGFSFSFSNANPNANTNPNATLTAHSSSSDPGTPDNRTRLGTPGTTPSTLDLAGNALGLGKASSAGSGGGGGSFDLGHPGSGKTGGLPISHPLLIKQDSTSSTYSSEGGDSLPGDLKLGLNAGLHFNAQQRGSNSSNAGSGSHSHLHVQQSSSNSRNRNKPAALFGFWFHTAFVEGKSFELRRDTVDGAKKAREPNKWPPQFRVEVLFD